MERVKALKFAASGTLRTMQNVNTTLENIHESDDYDSVSQMLLNLAESFRSMASDLEDNVYDSEN